MNIGDAAYKGDLVLVKVLVDSGVDVDIEDLEGFTPLMRASMGHQDDVVEYLLSQGADPTRRNARGRTALDLAREALNNSEYWKKDSKTFPLLEGALLQKFASESDETDHQKIVDEITHGSGIKAPLKKMPPIKFG